MDYYRSGRLHKTKIKVTGVYSLKEMLKIRASGTIAKVM